MLHRQHQHMAAHQDPQKYRVCHMLTQLRVWGHSNKAVSTATSRARPARLTCLSLHSRLWGQLHHNKCSIGNHPRVAHDPIVSNYTLVGRADHHNYCEVAVADVPGRLLDVEGDLWLIPTAGPWLAREEHGCMVEAEVEAGRGRGCELASPGHTVAPHQREGAVAARSRS